jgi:hypothetical protein
MMPWRIVTIVTCVMLASLLVLPPRAAMAVEVSPATRVAVFDFELIDTSLQGEMRGADEGEAARLTRLGEELREFFAAAPNVVLADIGPVRDAAAERNLHACNGCANKLAAEIGADLAVTGTVQKVSNLILNINIYIHDVAARNLVQRASADIRGNTDESWRRGVRYLLERRIFRD